MKKSLFILIFILMASLSYSLLDKKITMQNYIISGPYIKNYGNQTLNGTLTVDNLNVIGNYTNISVIDYTVTNNIDVGGMILFNGTPLDARYLKLDASNDPITGNLELNNNLRVGGYVGINTNPSVGTDLSISENDAIGVSVSNSVVTNYINGIAGSFQITSSASTDPIIISLIGVRGYATHGSTAAPYLTTPIIGGDFKARTSFGVGDDVVIPELTGVNSYTDMRGDDSTITNAYMFKGNYYKAMLQNVENMYGLYIPSLGGTNPYAIKTGTGLNSFGDDIYANGDNIKYCAGASQDVCDYYTGSVYKLNAEVGAPNYNISNFNEVQITGDTGVWGDYRQVVPTGSHTDLFFFDGVTNPATSSQAAANIVTFERRYSGTTSSIPAFVDNTNALFNAELDYDMTIDSGGALTHSRLAVGQFGLTGTAYMIGNDGLGVPQTLINNLFRATLDQNIDITMDAATEDATVEYNGFNLAINPYISVRTANNADFPINGMGLSLSPNYAEGGAGPTNFNSDIIGVNILSEPAGILDIDSSSFEGIRIEANPPMSGPIYPNFTQAIGIHGIELKGDEADFILDETGTRWQSNSLLNVSNDVYVDGNFTITGNISMYSTDGTKWSCGVSNGGVFSCS